MKKILMMAALSLSAISLVAQGHEHIHVYRNDKGFNTYKASQVTNIAFENQLMMVTTDAGRAVYPMSTVDSCVVRTTALPEIHVRLVDYPDWTELQGAKDDVRKAILYMDGNGMYDDLEEQEVEFRGRGNSTWNMDKKPYRFKMAKKKSVCGLPKAKTFALLANNIDCTEKIGIGGGSVDIDETTGMLFELDTNYDEAYKFRYTWSGKNIPVMVKDPDLDELAADPEVTNITDAAEYLARWQADFTKMANAVTTRKASQNLADVLDIESAVNYFLVNCLCGNHEVHHPKSVYMHKKSLADGELYHMGPVWDFDWAFTFDGKEGAPANTPLIETDGKANGYSFFKLILANQEFRALFKAKFEAFVKDGYPELKAFIGVKPKVR